MPNKVKILDNLTAEMVADKRHKRLIKFGFTGRPQSIITAMPYRKEAEQIAMAIAWIAANKLKPGYTVEIIGDIYIAYNIPMPNGFDLDYGLFYFA